MRSAHAVLGLVVVGLTLSASLAAGTYYGGSGTADDPYQIASPADWQRLMARSIDWDKSFILMADIDLAGITLTPVGTYETPPFNGVFDGKGHILRNIVINQMSDSFGLFGYVSGGYIKNLGLLDANISGQGAVVGALVGYNYQGTITSCYVTGSITGSDTCLGGLVGWNDGGTITSSHATASVSGGSCVGGLVGENGGTITFSCATSSVSGSSDIGGLVGYNHGTISFSYANSSVTNWGTGSSGHGIGGLMGSNNGLTTNCYATGSVMSKGDYVGGLCGANQMNGTFTACYSTGIVAGVGDYIGGMFGYDNYGTISACFWNIETSGMTTSADGIGLTTVQMKALSTFIDAGWDFESVWMICDGKDYPHLQWEGIQCPKYSGGSGTSEDPYKISTVADWQELMNTSTDWDKAFILMNDLDLAGVNLTPIAPDIYNQQDDFQGTPFTGVFEGNDHVIRNAVINQPASDWVGLFGCVGRGGQVKNLAMNNAIIQGRDFVGGLVGGNDGGTITSCYVTGTISGTGTQGNIGGLVGINLSLITSCYTTSAVNGILRVGGLVGYNLMGTVTSCRATGFVSGDVYVGGLLGYNDSEFPITCSYTTGSVTGRNHVGGLVGFNGFYSTTITACYATGTVTGTGTDIGGLVGHNEADTITHCYATGSVSGTGNYVGGLVGWNHLGTFITCFWDVETSGMTKSAGGTGLTTVEMQTLSTYTDAVWDFESVWMICEGKEYPHLQWEGIQCSRYGGGSGSSDDPYQIWTPEQFNTIGLYREDWNKSFILMADIDMSNYSNRDFNHIGDSNDYYSGIFNGNGHTVSNLTILEDWESHSVRTIFLYIGKSGVVQGLKLFNVQFAPGNDNGNETGVIAGNNYGIIENCILDSANIEAQGIVGGIVSANCGKINNCQIEYSNIFMTNRGGGNNMGGICGTNTGEIVDCHVRNCEIVTYEQFGHIGGLVGYCYEPAIVSDCSTSVVVRGNQQYIGGLIGFCDGSTITRCSSKGSVSGEYMVGGLIGFTYGNINDSYSSCAVTSSGSSYGVGGLCGSAQFCSLSRCYASGSVSGTNNVGGLVGESYECSITASFWDILTSGQATSDGGTGLSPAQMKTLATYTAVGWDFADTWKICDGLDYPHLQWELYDCQNISRYAGGSGTAEDPYQIRTAEQLQTLALHPDDWGKHFVLVANIDLSGYSGENLQIGHYAEEGDPNRIPFTGSFDGKGKTLSNYRYVGDDDRDYPGLFGYLGPGGHIRNLTADGVDIAMPNGSYAGGLVGISEGGTIADCHIHGRIVGQDGVGGIVGLNWQGGVFNCSVVGEIFGSQYVGGLAGYNYGGGRIEDCIFQGVAAGDMTVGGISAGSEENSQIVRCFATGQIRGNFSTGGIVGSNYFGSVVEDCGALCMVISQTFAGGLAGVNDFDASVARSFSAGVVTGGPDNGGLIAFGNGNVIDSFWDIETSGQSSSAGGEGKSAAEMKSAATFLAAGWDFVGETDNGTADLWKIREGLSYPRFASLAESPYDFVGDYGVNYEEYSVVAEQWGAVGCDENNDWCGGADLTGDGRVNLDDLAVLAEKWME